MSRIVERGPGAPPVILECEICGFNYRVTTITSGPMQGGLVWECRCGTRFLTPGGASLGFMRP
jgi:hypothetical protein